MFQFRNQMLWNLNTSGSLFVASRTNNVQTASYEDSSIAKILTKFNKAAAITIIRWSSKYHTGAITRHCFPIFTAVDIVERLVLQNIYVLNKEILQFLGLISAVYNQERFQIKSWL